MDIEKVIESLISQYKDFIDKLKIDQINLDEIASDYPSRKARYSLALEKMKAKLSKAKANLKVVYYQLYRMYREEAVSNGQKVTEEAIKSMIITDSKYLEAQEEVLKLEEIVGILQASKEGLDDVGRMLYLIADNPERKMGY